MKKLILTMAIAAMGFTAVFGQDSTKRSKREMPKLTAEQRAEKVTGNMEKKLSLTAEQKQKVYALELDKAKKMEAFRSANTSATKNKMKERKAEMDNNKAKLDEILTADQKTKLDASRSEAKEKMKGRRHGKNKGAKAPVVSNPPAQG